MNGKLPSDAFAYYVSLGDDRSYQAVADHYGVSKTGVTKRAVAEDWANRLGKIEQHARESLDKRLAETIEGMAERHLKMMRVVQHKALAALSTHPIDSAMDAIRAMDLAVKHERLIRGEPTERSAVSVEDTIKREYTRWLSHGDEDDWEDDDEPVTADGAPERPKSPTVRNDRRGSEDGLRVGADDRDEDDADDE